MDKQVISADHHHSNSTISFAGKAWQILLDSDVSFMNRGLTNEPVSFFFLNNTFDVLILICENLATCLRESLWKKSFQLALRQPIKMY